MFVDIEKGRGVAKIYKEGKGRKSPKNGSHGLWMTTTLQIIPEKYFIH